MGNKIETENAKNRHKVIERYIFHSNFHVNWCRAYINRGV